MDREQAWELLCEYTKTDNLRRHALELLRVIVEMHYAEVGHGHAAALSEPQLKVLGHALADAVAHRDPSGQCNGCDESPAGLCEDHAADLDKADAYLELARQLEIEVDR